MEVIEVSSYTAEEKRFIARDYLAPQAKETSGLKDAKVDLPEDSIDFLIRHYARESGVRNLRKLLEKVYRKVAFSIVKEHGNEESPISAATTTSTPEEDSSTPKTTEPREPMKVPESVSVTLSPAKLREYLGPCLLYTSPSPRDS